MTTTEATQEAAAMPLETYIEAGQREFARYAHRIAEIERAADIEPGSLVDSLLSGIDYAHAPEIAGYVAGGWDCGESEADIEAAIRPLAERWKREGADRE